MLVDIQPEAALLLIDIANDEIKSIESGSTTYGDRDDNLDTISTLAEAVTALEKARGW